MPSRKPRSRSTSPEVVVRRHINEDGSRRFSINFQGEQLPSVELPVPASRRQPSDNPDYIDMIGSLFGVETHGTSSSSAQSRPGTKSHRRNSSSAVVRTSSPRVTVTFSGSSRSSRSHKSGSLPRQSSSRKTSSQCSNREDSSSASSFIPPSGATRRFKKDETFDPVEICDDSDEEVDIPVPRDTPKQSSLSPKPKSPKMRFGFLSRGRRNTRKPLFPTKASTEPEPKFHHVTKTDENKYDAPPAYAPTPTPPGGQYPVVPGQFNLVPGQHYVLQPTTIPGVYTPRPIYPAGFPAMQPSIVPRVFSEATGTESSTSASTARSQLNKDFMAVLEAHSDRELAKRGEKRKSHFSIEQDAVSRQTKETDTDAIRGKYRFSGDSLLDRFHDNHFCTGCGSMRSKNYHEKHPIRAGKKYANLCRKCRSKQEQAGLAQNRSRDGKKDKYKEKDLRDRLEVAQTGSVAPSMVSDTTISGQYHLTKHDMPESTTVLSGSSSSTITPSRASSSCKSPRMTNEQIKHTSKPRTAASVASSSFLDTSKKFADPIDAIIEESIRAGSRKNSRESSRSRRHSSSQESRTSRSSLSSNGNHRHNSHMGPSDSSRTSRTYQSPTVETIPESRATMQGNFVEVEAQASTPVPISSAMNTRLSSGSSQGTTIKPPQKSDKVSPLLPPVEIHPSRGKDPTIRRRQSARHIASFAGPSTPTGPQSPYRDTSEAIRQVHFDKDATPPMSPRNYSYPMANGYDPNSPRHRTLDGVAHVHPEHGRSPNLKTGSRRVASEHCDPSYYTRSAGPLFPEHGYHQKARQQQQSTPRSFSAATDSPSMEKACKNYMPHESEPETPDSTSQMPSRSQYDPAWAAAMAFDGQTPIPGSPGFAETVATTSTVVEHTVTPVYLEPIPTPADRAGFVAQEGPSFDIDAIFDRIDRMEVPEMAPAMPRSRSPRPRGVYSDYPYTKAPDESHLPWHLRKENHSSERAAFESEEAEFTALMHGKNINSESEICETRKQQRDNAAVNLDVLLDGCADYGEEEAENAHRFKHERASSGSWKTENMSKATIVD